MFTHSQQNLTVSEARLSDQVDIIEVVTQEGVTLKKVGKSWQGICPLHKEKTPSFVVYPDSNSFHCFGCQESGDPISFIQKLLGYDFKSACEHLAIELKSNQKSINKTRSSLPKSTVKGIENRLKSELQSAHQTNLKLLLKLENIEIKPHPHFDNIYQETLSQFPSLAYEQIANNRDYYYPITDKTVGKNRVKITGHKIKWPQGKDVNPKCKWQYIERKHPINKSGEILTHKRFTNTYKSLQDVNLTSDMIPFYLADKFPS